MTEFGLIIETANMSSYSIKQIQSLVQPDRVHRDIYEDPALFDLEMERVFGRSWVFVGHESQVPKPGDFFCTRIGLQPVVMTRHSDGKVYVVYNRCAHRGVKVVNEECGNTGRFMCMYHGWTYDTNGDLDFVTQPEGYPDHEFDKVKHGMGRVAQWGSHHGFVFANLSSRAGGMKDWLGENADFLDDVAISAPAGEVEITGGVHRYLYHGNWKMQVENLIDMYHPAYSHESSSAKGGQQFTRRGGDKGGIQFFEKPGRVKSMDGLGTHALPNGHTWQGGLPPVENNSDDHREYVRLLEKKHGPEKTKDILIKKRHNVIFYPNMAMQELNPHIRVIRPLAVDRTEILIYPVKLKGAPEQMFRDQLINLNKTHSPTSLVQTDDVEAFARAQEGIQSSGNEWILLARKGPEERFNSGRIRTTGTSEEGMRNHHRAWLKYMCGQT